MDLDCESEIMKSDEEMSRDKPSGTSAPNHNHYSNCISTTKPLPNYYWRKYEGVIPKDAIPGGYTANGKITYIGQVLVLGKYNTSAIIPGVIHVGQEEVEAAYLGLYRSKEYAAILCSNTPAAFKWIRVNIYELQLLTEYLVVGGYEIDQIAYIGRASQSNNLIIGKVFNQRLKTLLIATADGTQIAHSNFEILIHQPDKNGVTN